jgi:ankyrin repeat protein
VEFLFANGADIHAYGDGAVEWASECGHLHVVEFLVANGADVRSNNINALTLASRNGHLHVVEFLVSVGADIHNYEFRWDSECVNHISVVNFLTTVERRWKIATISLNQPNNSVEYLVPELIDILIDFVCKPKQQS